MGELSPQELAALQVNIHDVTLEHGIVPYPLGVWESYKKDNLAFKQFQSRWYEYEVKMGRMLQSHVPTFANLPVQMKDLPTHFYKREGKRLFGINNIDARRGGEPIMWPQAAIMRIPACVNNSDDPWECKWMANRGNFCTKCLDNFKQKVKNRPSVDN